MRRLTSLLAVAWLVGGLAGCGGASKSPATRASHVFVKSKSDRDANDSPKPVFSKIDADRDNDIGVKFEDKQHPEVTNFGHEANRSDGRAIKTLLARYYRTAAAEDGPTACSLIYSPIAEAAPEDVGHTPPGPPYAHGTTCAEVMNKLFTHLHNQLKAQSARLKVTHVRLEGRHGLAVLDFGSRMPLRQIQIAREGPTWKVGAVLDAELP